MKKNNYQTIIDFGSSELRLAVFNNKLSKLYFKSKFISQKKKLWRVFKINKFFNQRCRGKNFFPSWKYNSFVWYFRNLHYWPIN